MRTSKKWSGLLCLIMMLVVLFSVTTGYGEEEAGEGTVIVVDHTLEELNFEGTTAETEPFIPDDVEKAIFGTDDRITIKNTAQYPYSAIAYMEVRGKCGCNWTGTGFMVDKDRLLTAAHCLVCPDHSEWAKSITFYFGYKNSRNYKYKYTGGWNAWAGNIFRDREYTIDGDYGCVKLDKKVGDKVGWLGYYYGLSDSSIESKFVYVAGYRDGVLKYDSGFVKANGSQHINYQMDTLPGNSGGPIFTSDYYAVGINIANNVFNNVGYRITNAVYNDLMDLN